jgi:flavin reductase (DIM6/NTAB) family NADH-FMN oxidoreductase RutF
MLTSAKQAVDPEFDTQHFRAALSQFATGVTIITTRDQDGSFFGLTASSFNSVSLTPPLVLWSLGQKSRSMPLFAENSHYVINVLAADQAELAERFASRLDDRFSGVDFSLSQNGLPILGGVSAWFECHNRSRHPEGDHVIFVGEVERCGFAEGQPLVYQASQFGTLAALS